MWQEEWNNISYCERMWKAATKGVQERAKSCKTSSLETVWEIKSKKKWKWYEHGPEGVVENEEVKILWDAMLQCDREIKARKFENDAEKFYKEIGKEKITVSETPAIKDIERFWDTIWSEEEDFNDKAEWIRHVQTNIVNMQEQQWSDISVEELQTALKNTINGSQQE